jgi:hypothetical protein
MITATLRNAVRTWDTDRLQALRVRLEAQLIAQIQDGTAHARKHAFLREVNVITAAAEEIQSRPLPPPHVPYVEVDQETVLGDPGTLVRSQRSYRVF